MTLNNAKIGLIYTVNSINLDRAIISRLEALGLTNGTNIKILNCNKGGSAMLMVRGTRLALGNKITDAIYIKEAS